jgi:hypothetical protein
MISDEPDRASDKFISHRIASEEVTDTLLRLFKGAGVRNKPAIEADVAAWLVAVVDD